jgi:hypothetical protein
MKKGDDKLDQLFDEFQNQWDFEELNSNHNEQFFEKLKNKKNKRNYFIPFAVAASLLFIVGISFFYNANNKPKDLKFASKETMQTDSIFTVLIQKELTKIKEKKSPENEKIITDALKQMKILDHDYQTIIQELETNGESKQIINALITNLQTRISFLQNVLQHIDNNQKIQSLSDEKTI